MREYNPNNPEQKGFYDKYKGREKYARGYLDAFLDWENSEEEIHANPRILAKVKALRRIVTEKAHELH